MNINSDQTTATTTVTAPPISTSATMQPTAAPMTPIDDNNMPLSSSLSLPSSTDNNIPSVPLYMHDLSELLFTHLQSLNHLPSPAPQNFQHYSRLTLIFLRSNGPMLHYAGPRHESLQSHIQSLFQGALFFIEMPPILSFLIPSSHLFPTCHILSSALVLLVALFCHQPKSHHHHQIECIRLNEFSVSVLRNVEQNGTTEDRMLINFLFQSGAVRIVANLRHGPAITPLDLMNSFNSNSTTVGKWTPKQMYGLNVPVAEAVEVINEMCKDSDEPNDINEDNDQMNEEDEGDDDDDDDDNGRNGENNNNRDGDVANDNNNNNNDNGNYNGNDNDENNNSNNNFHQQNDVKNEEQIEEMDVTNITTKPKSSAPVSHIPLHISQATISPTTFVVPPPTMTTTTTTTTSSVPVPVSVTSKFNCNMSTAVPLTATSTTTTTTTTTTTMPQPTSTPSLASQYHGLQNNMIYPTITSSALDFNNNNNHNNTSSETVTPAITPSSSESLSPVCASKRPRNTEFFGFSSIATSPPRPPPQQHAMLITAPPTPAPAPVKHIVKPWSSSSAKLKPKLKSKAKSKLKLKPKSRKTKQVLLSTTTVAAAAAAAAAAGSTLSMEPQVEQPNQFGAVSITPYPVVVNLPTSAKIIANQYTDDYTNANM